MRVTKKDIIQMVCEALDTLMSSPKTNEGLLFDFLDSLTSSSQYICVENNSELGRIFDIDILEISMDGHSGDMICINRIKMKNHGSGSGTRLFTLICQWADRNNKTLTLTPSDDMGATSISRLVKFYKRFGFVENKGKNSNFATRQGMYRNPNNTELNESVDEMELYHGSLANKEFDKFDSQYLSTGWGEQLYGYGHYFTNSIEAAKQYAGNGVLYTVEVPDGKYLSYKSISTQEKRRIANLFYKFYTTEHEYGSEAHSSEEAKRDFWNYECKYLLDCEDGGDIYGTIASILGNDEETSKFLKSIGYVGIKWNDRNFNQNVTNYVIFDDNDINITSRHRLQSSNH